MMMEYIMNTIIGNFKNIYESIENIKNMLNTLPPDVNVAPIMYELEDKLQTNIEELDKLIFQQLT